MTESTYTKKSLCKELRVDFDKLISRRDQSQGLVASCELHQNLVAWSLRLDSARF